MKMHLVSIIIPLYNSADYIVECVTSCTRQTYRDIEVLVVDDGSSDNGLKVARDIAKKDRRVKVFHKKNGGVSSARNLGIEKSRGDYLCFIDADDYLEGDFIENMVSCMVECDADFCFSDRTWSSDDVSSELHSNIISSSETEKQLLGTKINVGCWNKIYTRNCIKNIRFDESLFYGEGLKFILSVAHNAKRIAICDCASYHYRRVNPESATTKFSLDKMDNGDKSLLEIRKIIENDGVKVQRVWRQHHALFCLNAMMGIMDAGFDGDVYRKWRKEFLADVFSGVFAEASFKIRLKMLMGVLCPRILHASLKKDKNE
ncbi:glycosyltransferase family 2 protein [Candidatus Saccharibacteria bacterium]|nr:glycosyltransferase family 2 protein [Candidatus Saccharibacteria bacterium]